jgi:hypothetical protein
MISARRAAHFLLLRELAGSPLNEAFVDALIELGYEVDLYAPGDGTSDAGATTGIRPVEYGRRWILKHALSPGWRRYALFSGTTEDPMAVVGILSWLHRRPSCTLADEIKSDAYRGDRPESWKRLCRWAMRRSALSIVGSAERTELQRNYARLPARHRIIVYPSCFRVPPVVPDRGRLRRERNIPENALVLAYSGTFGHFLGAEWMLAALEALPDLHVFAKVVSMDPLIGTLLARVRGSERLHVEATRLPWRDAGGLMAAADIGMVVYQHQGSQFQRMGTSSNRLCMFLTMGLPVIVSRQPSFAFIEKYDCGVMVESEREFVNAIQQVSRRLGEMKRNAVKCAAEYIDAHGRYTSLLAELGAIV